MHQHHLGLAFGLLLAGCSSPPSSPNDPATAGSPNGPTNAAGATNSGGATGGATSSTDGGHTAGGMANGTTNAGSANGGSANANGGSANANGGYWKPTAGLTWQWQLSEEVGTPLDVDVYDIDWEADKATVDKLHGAGIKVICYVSVGSWEDFRPDAKDFPSAVIGNDYDGWPGEKYVDIRSDALRAVMNARFDLCQRKGFDAIEPDNMDVFELGQDSGFPLTEKDGIAYAKWLANAAHSRGLGIGQKNAASITGDIAATYDWALTESCYSDGNWCGDVKAYATANKPVFMCEYEAASFGAACSAWKPKSYSPILKSLDLDAPVTFCP
ncbi:MAG: endo alpha-1,4 polygalactosaminidase [Myxococcales bacterium]